MSAQCPACGEGIEPFMGGHPVALTIPWHPTSTGKPCGASQGPYRAPSATPKAPTAPTASQASGIRANPLIKAVPARAWLKAPSTDANIALWLDLVEKQTGKPFQLDGDAYCVAEELGETVEAIFRNDQAQVEDGLCDVYVTAAVAELLIRRGDGGLTGHRPVMQPWDSLSGPMICAIFSGRLAAYVRKPKTTERAKWVLDSLLTAKAAVRRDIKEMGVAWDDAIGKVLDILDKRLGQGYAMSPEGSAIKKADQ